MPEYGALGCCADGAGGWLEAKRFSDDAERVVQAVEEVRILFQLRGDGAGVGAEDVVELFAGFG